MNRFYIHLTTRLLVLLLLLAAVMPSLPLHAQVGDDYLPAEVVIKLVQVADLAGVTADYGLEPTPISQFGVRPIYRLRILDGAAPPDKAEALTSDARVLYAEPNFLEQTPEGQQRTSWAAGGGGEAYAAQWVADKIRLSEAHMVTRGSGVVVAVLDTGIDLNHPQLVQQLVGGYDFVDMDTDPQEEGTYGVNIGYGHGTHVAGLVALTAPDAKIMPVRVLDAEGVGNIWVLAEALAYAVNPDGDLTTDDGADVINLSLSTTRPTKLIDDIVQDIVCSSGDDDDDDDDNDNGVQRNGKDQRNGNPNDDDNDDDDDDDDNGNGNTGSSSTGSSSNGSSNTGSSSNGSSNNGSSSNGSSNTGSSNNDSSNDHNGTCLTFAGLGVVVVAAAGNRGSDTPEYPANEKAAGVLAVAASTSADQLAAFSNYGAWVQLAAPGEQVMSSVPGGGYGVWSGTSMSAPITAGVAALVRAAQPKLDAGATANTIVASAAHMASSVSRRVDAAAALGLSLTQSNASLVTTNGQAALFLPVLLSN